MDNLLAEVVIHIIVNNAYIMKNIYVFLWLYCSEDEELVILLWLKIALNFIMFMLFLVDLN